MLGGYSVPFVAQTDVEPETLCLRLPRACVAGVYHQVWLWSVFYNLHLAII